MGVSEQFPARLLSKPISSTFFSPSSRGRLVVALVFRVLLVVVLQDDRPPDGRAQVDGARRHVRDARPRVGPRAAHPGPAPRQHRAVRLPRGDGTARRPGRPTARGAGATLTPAPPRAGPPARRVGPATRRAAPVRGGTRAAGRRPGQVVGARRHALDAPARGAERVPRVRPGATLRRAAPLPLPHPRGSRSPLKLKSRRRLLFLIYALLATTTMLFSKEQPDLRTGAALCRAS